MSLSHTPAIERIARVLAARHASANAEGGQASTSGDVDGEWNDYVEDAIAVLKSMREPDGAMAMVGDADVWQRMISVALTDEFEHGQI